uniref:Uncharacterized protein n=1 Tax=Candidatus Kentrum sp. FW TaxID=2126338 RepID=A0A450SV78_9GAMM|nr:MAG: hypothetical protein BECKFW1821A_GA0114235_107610 [Candidatus Kentron sp. FW]
MDFKNTNIKRLDLQDRKLPDTGFLSLIDETNRVLSVFILFISRSALQVDQIAMKVH